MKLPIWLKQALSGRERAVRYTNPGIVAYYWDGGAPKRHAVKDISSTGAYLDGNELWCVGTVITLTLQKEDGEGEGGAEVPFVSLSCRVVRHTPGGTGIEFMLRTDKERRALREFMRSAVQKSDKRGEGGAAGVGGAARGQALVELMAVIPMLFLLIALAFNFGTWLYGWVAVGNATRAAGDYAILSGASAGLPPTATSATLQSLVTTDLTHLPYQSSTNPKACIQKNDNGVITTLLEMPSGACADYSNPPLDTEPIVPGGTATHPNVAVDITYTYTSFFTGARILGLPLTVLPGTIHRRAVMRILI